MKAILLFGLALIFIALGVREWRRPLPVEFSVRFWKIRARCGSFVLVGLGILLLYGSASTLFDR
jgi:hypothetical protein